MDKEGTGNNSATFLAVENPSHFHWYPSCIGMNIISIYMYIEIWRKKLKGGSMDIHGHWYIYEKYIKKLKQLSLEKLMQYKGTAWKI
jgi:hypothetical protein